MELTVSLLGKGGNLMVYVRCTWDTHRKISLDCAQDNVQKGACRAALAGLTADPACMAWNSQSVTDRGQLRQAISSLHKSAGSGPVAIPLGLRELSAFP